MMIYEKFMLRPSLAFLLFAAVAAPCGAQKSTVVIDRWSGELAAENTFRPTAQWLPDPRPIENASAAMQSEMKRYTETLSGSGVTFEMIPIPGGRFIMGSPTSEEYRKADEGPRHEVVVEPFWMGKCEVTWKEFEQWSAYLDRWERDRRARSSPGQAVPSNPWDEAADAVSGPSEMIDAMTQRISDDYPALGMSHLSARIYCKWLSAKTGRYYRLPTEAEWEYACRAGTTTAYSFGDNPGDAHEFAWHFKNSPDGPGKAGVKKPNPWGLHDMHGNAAEWVIDQYVADFYTRPIGKGPNQPLAVPEARFPRVLRGGHWDHDPADLRSAARMPSSQAWAYPNSHSRLEGGYFGHFVGFRVVRPLCKPTVKQCERLEAAQRELTD